MKNQRKQKAKTSLAVFGVGLVLGFVLAGPSWAEALGTRNPFPWTNDLPSEIVDAEVLGIRGKYTYDEWLPAFRGLLWVEVGVILALLLSYVVLPVRRKPWVDRWKFRIYRWVDNVAPHCAACGRPILRTSAHAMRHGPDPQGVGCANYRVPVHAWCVRALFAREAEAQEARAPPLRPVFVDQARGEKMVHRDVDR